MSSKNNLDIQKILNTLLKENSGANRSKNQTNCQMNKNKKQSMKVFGMILISYQYLFYPLSATIA